LTLRGYFEDFNLFVDNIPFLKDRYPKVEKREDNDLVIHFRAGDRLFYKNEFNYKPSVDSYLSAINNFNFNRLHIVTDMPEWDYLSEDKLSKIKFHCEVPLDKRVSPKLSVDYFNSFVESFKQFNPIVEKRSIYDDFNFIRSFDNILFEHGTMSWWASILSDATKVGVYGPWRSWKGKNNKNLSKVPVNGWFITVNILKSGIGCLIAGLIEIFQILIGKNISFNLTKHKNKDILLIRKC
jgi:hypothetical protein